MPVRAQRGARRPATVDDMTEQKGAPGTEPDVNSIGTGSAALKQASAVAQAPAAVMHPGGFAPQGAYPAGVAAGYPEIDLEQVPDDGSFNPLLDPNYTALQLALAQAVERDPEGATAFYLETCEKGPRAMVRRIVDGIVPGAPRVPPAVGMPGGVGGSAGTGLPRRPGATVCIEYSRLGGCALGAACPYDHPTG